MKKLITIFLILFAVTSYAQTTHYISSSGSDGTGDGSIGNPWATLYKACNSVTTSGDIIYAKAGTYNETQEAILAVGVSIDGAGQGIAIINNTLNSSGHYAIRLASTTEGTNGNQYIRNITLTGSSLTGLQGIYINRRSNVSIYNCTILNFVQCAIYLEGNSSFGSAPTVYSSNNLIYNDSIINCSDRGGSGAGMIGIGGQDGLLIHDNYLNQTARPATHNGNIVWAVEGFNKNFKFYNNMSIKPDTDGSNWNFHLETWNNQGGNEAYNNTFIGGSALDCGYYYAVKGASTYSYSFHDNLVELSAQQPSSSYPATGVNFETAGGDALIYNNHFKNIAAPIEIEGNPTVINFSNLNIHNNIFENSGYSDGSFGYAIFLYATANDTIQNINIDNNSFKNTATTITCFIDLNSESSAILQNVNCRNNIFQGASAWMRFRTFSGIIRTFTLQNNIKYSNGNSNNIIYDTSPPTGLTETGSINSNPLLNTNFTLQSGSPAIGAGINVGYGTDIGAIHYATTIQILPHPIKQIYINR